MNFGYDNFTENNEIIKRETKSTVLICISTVVSVLLLALISNYSTKSTNSLFTSLQPDDMKLIFNVLNIAAILIVIIVLAVRKTIYYSSHTIKDDFSLIQILRKWRTIDIILSAIAELIAIMGLTISLLGMPFGRTFHFFVTSALVILIIMPINWKVRDKLRILNQQRDMDVEF